MTKASLMVQAPPVIDAERLIDPAYTVRGQSSGGKVLVHYDPDRRCGGVFFVGGEMWAVWGPLAFAEFVAALDSRGVNIPESDSLASWVATCSAGSSNGTAH